MAPPAKRQTGYSRRAQYGRFLAVVATVLGALAAGAVLLHSLGNHAAGSGARSLAADVTSPIAGAASGVRAGIDNTAAAIAGFATFGAQNAALKREVALARVRLAAAAATETENQRLKALLGLAGQNPRPVAFAWLIASTDTSSRRYATISAGANRGVAPGMPVRSALGLVGRVTEVGHATARVLLVVDSESVVPVRRASDGLPAFASGTGNGSLQIRLLSLGINPLKVGDAFVASGSGGLYWPGTPVAVVSALTRDGAKAQVLANPSASEQVAVQPEWNPVQDATLPPPAATTPPPKPKPRRAKPVKPAHHHWL